MKVSGIPASVDEYISTFPVNIQKKLKELRSAIKESAPQAEEKISYRMPAFIYHGILVYFAAQTNHIGFYPTSSGVDAFRNELTGYKTSRGAIRFPFSKPLPLDLIKRIVLFRVQENLVKGK